jgi:uncharacterized protein
MQRENGASVVASKYNILIPLTTGRVLAYNSASGATAVWSADDRAVFEAIERGHPVDTTGPCVQELVFGGFVVDAALDELAEVRDQYLRARNDADAMVLTVAPTLMCNFGCDYCFQGPNKPLGNMSDDVQRAIVQLVAHATIKRLHVAWYGGEPLLAQGVILSLSHALQNECAPRGVQYDSMMVTNGYKLTPRVASELRTVGLRQIQVTLDGAKVDHDRRRVRLNGGASFERIVSNVEGVLAANLDISIVARVNIDERNKESIPDLLGFLATRGLSVSRGFGVYFAPVEAITEGCHVVAEHCMTKREYARLEVQLTRRAYELGLSRLPYPPRHRGLCGALRPKGLVVLPNGDLHKCWDTVTLPERRVGTIWDVAGVDTNENAIRWASWTPFGNEVCLRCKLLPNCGGACAHKFINAGDTLGEAGALPCPSWKYNVREKLLVMAWESGSLPTGEHAAEELDGDCSTIGPEHAMPARTRPRRSLPLFPDHDLETRLLGVAE